jgi:hypothetical protein
MGRIFMYLLVGMVIVTGATWGWALENPCCPGGDLVATTIQAPPAGFWTPRGRIGEAVMFASGERLEIWWTGFFPRYELKYFKGPVDKGETIGHCHFSHGCNRVFYSVPRSRQGNPPSCFTKVTWESYDYGYDGGVPGYLDRYVHTFDRCTGRSTEVHELLHYRCPPPISHYPDLCAGVCEPPYDEEVVDGEVRPKVFKHTDVSEKIVSY